MVNDKVLKTDKCSSEGVRRQQCTESFCECIHAIEVPENKIVDLVLITEGIIDVQFKHII